MTPAIPEQAVVDAGLSDPLAAAVFLERLGVTRTLRIGAVDDLARAEGISLARLHAVASAFLEIGLIGVTADGFVLTEDAPQVALFAAALRGAAYAQHRHVDANSVEITLSPPAHPSRLMEVLPKQGFSWARLFHTKDSLVELASQARRRFVIASPFLDDQGLQWVEQLIEATPTSVQERILIMRGQDDGERILVGARLGRLAHKPVRVLRYAVTHDPAFRTPTIETFHAKILLADNDKAYIGSANMTRASRDFSMECGAIVRGPAVRPVATLIDAIMQVAAKGQA